MKTITLPIDNEFADELVGLILKEHTDIVKRNIQDFKHIKKPKSYQIEDYDYNVKLLEALKVVNEYFGN